MRKGQKHSKESIKKMRLAHSNVSVATRNKMSKSHLGIPFPVWRRKLMSRYLTGVGNPFYGKRHRKSTKKVISKKISKILKRQYKIGIRTAGWGTSKSGRNQGYRKDLGHHCRSTWEANYARHLVNSGISYVYEPERFYLKELDCTYLPDFLLEDGTYVEVKGYDSPDAKAKRKAFRKQYGYKLIVIGKKRYDKIRHDYSSLINNWE